jgi:septal ring factor EnvC (AmiA/AmiB activator)
MSRRLIPFFAGLVLLALGCAALNAANPRYGHGRGPAPVPKRVPRPVPADPRMGTLAWPVVGRLVSRFGLQVDPKYGTKTKNLGVDIVCAKGCPVKAALAGRVSYSDRFMGYGLTVIIDHGDRLHSIYAGLSESRVAVGRQVERGETIAFAGDTLQFQVRKEGQSQDPEAWLGSPPR